MRDFVAQNLFLSTPECEESWAQLNTLKVLQPAGDRGLETGVSTK
jgi:hypothetical protein